MSGIEHDSAAQPGSPQQPLAREAVARRKRRDMAAILPAAGAFLLASPFLDVLAGGGTLLGVPAATLYVFAVWAALILATWLLARRLADDEG